MFYIYAAYYYVMVSLVICVKYINVFQFTPHEVLFLHIGSDE